MVKTILTLSDPSTKETCKAPLNDSFRNMLYDDKKKQKSPPQHWRPNSKPRLRPNSPKQKLSGCAKNALRSITGLTAWSKSSDKNRDVWIAWKTCLGSSVKYLFLLILNPTGMYDFKMKITICFKFSEGLSKLMYNLKVSHLKCDRGPGSQIDKTY